MSDRTDIIKNKYKQIILKQKLLLVIIMLVIILTIVDRNFFNLNNIISIFDQISINGIMAIGMTLLLISGFFDLSIGSVMALSGIISIILQPYGLFISILMGLFLGVVVGTINGLLVVQGKINAFIVTLGTMFIVNGLALAITNSQPVSSQNASFNNISQGSIYNISYIIFYFITLLLISWFIFKNTKFGRYSFAIGSSESSTKLAGIKTNVFIILFFIFCSLMAAIAGILFSSKVATGSATFGDNIVLIVITGVILGGTSLYGGRGSILGTLEGLVILILIEKAMVVFNIYIYWQLIFRGGVILIVIILDVLTYRKKKFEY